MLLGGADFHRAEAVSRRDTGRLVGANTVDEVGQLAGVTIRAFALDDLFFLALLEQPQRLVFAADVVVGGGPLEDDAVRHVEAPAGCHRPASLGADLGAALDLVLRQHMVDGAADLGEAGRVNRLWLAEEMLHEVGVVYVQVEQRAAGGFAVEVDGLPPGRRLCDSLKMGTEHLAVAAAVNRLLDPGPLRPKAQAHGHHEMALGLCGGLGDLPGLGDGSGEGLFADHMFARDECRLGHAQVCARGCADVDDIDRLVGEELVEILIGLDL